MMQNKVTNVFSIPSLFLLLLPLSFRTHDIVRAAVDENSLLQRNEGGETQNSNLLSMELLPAKRVLERRLNEMRRLNKDSDLQEVAQVEIAALYQGYGTHYVDLWLGTPEPQRQTVIVDTGSEVISFPCKGCKDCGEKYHTDKYFDPSKSDSFQKTDCDSCAIGYCKKRRCRIHMGYSEGSEWTAYEATDWLYAGGSHTVADTVTIDSDGKPISSLSSIATFETQIAFGCQTSLTGLFRTQLADGIMGMSNDEGTFWEQMYTAGTIQRKQFSLCFNKQGYADKEGTNAGAMTLGGFDTRLHKSPMVYAEDIGNGSGFFEVYVKNVYLREGGGESVLPDSDNQKLTKLDVNVKRFNRGDTIVDSGTTISYFHQRLAEPFKKAWKDMTGHEFSLEKIKITDEELTKLPTILIQLQGIDSTDADGIDPNEVPGLVGDIDPSSPYDILVAIPPSHYISSNNDGTYSLRISIDGSSTTLGANTMQGHDVFFDIENKRIGFAESNCDYADIENEDIASLENITEPGSIQISEAKNTNARGRSIFVGFSLLAIFISGAAWAYSPQRKPRHENISNSDGSSEEELESLSPKVT